MNAKIVHSLAISEAAALLKHRDFLGGDLDMILADAAYRLRQIADELVQQEGALDAQNTTPDCRTCFNFAHAKQACVVGPPIVCIGGDAYVPSDPLRLWADGGKVKP